jgi:hypothetical protein
MNLATIYNALNNVGIPITQVFFASENTEDGIIANKIWLIRVAKNQKELILLDEISLSGTINIVSSFTSIDDLLQFVMEN